MTRIRLAVDTGKPMTERERLVEYTSEEEAAADRDEQAWQASVVERQTKDDARAELVADLRKGTVGAADLQAIIADLLEGKL